MLANLVLILEPPWLRLSIVRINWATQNVRLMSTHCLQYPLQVLRMCLGIVVHVNQIISARLIATTIPRVGKALLVLAHVADIWGPHDIFTDNFLGRVLRVIVNDDDLKAIWWKALAQEALTRLADKKWPLVGADDDGKKGPRWLRLIDPIFGSFL